MTTSLSSSDARDLRAEIDGYLTHIDWAPKKKRTEALDAANALSSKSAEWAKGLAITRDQLRYWVEQDLIKPMRLEGTGRATNLYGREHIRDMVFIYVLYTKHNLSYTRIANLLHEIGQGHNPETLDYLPHEVRQPDQSRRGLLTLRTRLVGVLLSELFGTTAFADIVVHIRALRKRDVERPLGGDVALAHTWLDTKESVDLIADIRDDDIWGWVTRDAEVLFSGLSPADSRRLGYVKWVTIKIGSAFASSGFHISAGFKEGNAAEVQPIDRPVSRQVILRICQALFRQLDLPPSSEMSARSKRDFSTPIQTLAELVPSISDNWEYCAVLVPNEREPRQLRLLATSSDFPPSVQDNILVSDGQMVSGWVYKWNSRMVIPLSFGDNDFRLAHQFAENATAALGIPTRVRGETNGVLYVGTRAESNGDVFSDPEIRVLTIVADLIGETIDRRKARIAAEKIASDTIREPALQVFEWEKLNERIIEVLTKLERDGRPAHRNDNLQFMAVQIRTPSTVQSAYPGVRQWMLDHVLSTTHQFFVAEGRSKPEFFLGKADMPDEFVCLFPRVSITDEEDRRLRDRLRALLNSVRVVSPVDDSVAIPVHVWSLPFRLQKLHTRLQEPDQGARIESVCIDLMGRITTSFRILEHVEAAHEEEKRRNYGGALEHFTKAYHIAPDSAYILRHIAKYTVALGRYESSLEWWERLLSTDVHAKNFRRYASALANTGKFEQAKENYLVALRLNETDVETLVEIGDFYFANDMISDALGIYEEAVVLPTADSDALWLRIAETHLRRGDMSRAREYAEMVLRKDPDHLDAKRLLVQMARANDSAT